MPDRRSTCEVVLAFGTRPEAIKMAPLALALAADERFTPRIVVTAQHRQMLDQVLDTFGLEPAIDLDLMTPRQSLPDLTARALAGLGEAVAKLEPDVVVVQGDTTTTLAGSLAAFYARVPVVHLEAGLRTGDLASPFPEEMNRQLTTRLAALHLAPTATAAHALLAEGVKPDDVVVTGNTVIDALLWVAARPAPDEPLLAELASERRRIVLVTTHRRESFGAPMRELAEAIAELAQDPTVHVVFPLHRNPEVRGVMTERLAALDNVRLVDPLDYAAFVHTMRLATLILTDSGGVQEEAPSLGVPVLVLRDTTERPDAVAAGTARLVGTDRATVVAAARHLLDDPVAHATMAAAHNPYGDGTAALASVEAMAARFASASASSTSSRRMPNTNRIASR